MPNLRADTSVTTTAGALVIDALGTQVRVKVDGPRAEDVNRHLLRAWARCREGRLSRAGDTVRVATHTGTDPIAVLPDVTVRVTRALIGAQTGRLLMLHAGAVCHPSTGRSLVYVAEGGAGKTTLTRALAQRYGYLTDETVAIDDEDRVLAYPKPLSMRPAPTSTADCVCRGPGTPWLPKQEHSPDDLGLVRAPAVATVARLVLLDRVDDHGGEPDVAELGLLDAVTAIAPQTSALYALPSGLRRCADLIEATGPVLRVRYSEAESLRDLTAELIGRPT